VKVVELPRGGICVFTDDGARLVVTRDAEGRLWVDHDGGRSVVAAPGDLRAARSGGETGASDGIARAPAGGRVAAILVEPGAHVEAGAAVAIVELMKAEVRVPAPVAGRIDNVHVAAGDTVQRGAPLVTVGSCAGDLSARSQSHTQET
jgi:biotin carboxyl carrier protein